MLFQYKAYKDNKIVTKRIEADSKEIVLDYLKSNNFFPLEINKVGTTGSSLLTSLLNHISFNDIVGFTRQLAIMLNAGLTLTDSFSILKKQITQPTLLKMIEDIDKEIRGGSNFSSALRKYPHLFSNLYISLIRSGEASGKLSEIMLKLADNLEKRRAFQGKIKGALIYPVIIIVGMFIVSFIMMAFVLPKLLELYKDFNVKLPAMTQFLIITSSFSSKFWPLILGGVAVMIFFLKSYLSTKKGKYFFDLLILKIPVIKNVVEMSALVDSTRTLSILISSGVSILEGLEIIIDTTSNAVYQQSFKSVHKQVEKGVSLGTAMINEGIFPPILVQMTIVGEQTGQLDDTMLRISNYFEMESTLAVKTMTTLIEPAILVVLGLGVGFLVTAIITPIYNLTNSFQGQ